jgi:hypothetical protein
MARKYSPKKRSNKIEPAVMTLTFATASPGTGVRGRSYIDLSQVASLANRRFYRQGINWAVGGFKVSSLQAGTVNICKLPNTWVMSNAWEKGMRSWQRMNKEALMETESVRPKFLDFKVFADHAHAVAGTAANLLPVAIGAGAIAVPAIPGEWEMSKFVIPNSANPGFSTEREIIATGANYQGNGASGFNSVSLIEGYAASRGLPNVLDPNAPDDAADVDGAQPANYLQALFNEGTNQDEQILEDMVSENNIAPYPFENDGVNSDTMYPGGANQLTGLELHDFVTVFETNVTSGIGIQRLKGGNFPCGLIAVDWTPVSNANLLIQIDLVPGNHRGYLCEPMTEM